MGDRDEVADRLRVEVVEVIGVVRNGDKSHHLPVALRNVVVEFVDFLNHIFGNFNLLVPREELELPDRDRIGAEVPERQADSIGGHGVSRDVQRSDVS